MKEDLLDALDSLWFYWSKFKSWIRGALGWNEVDRVLYEIGRRELKPRPKPRPRLRLVVDNTRRGKEEKAAERRSS